MQYIQQNSVALAVFAFGYLTALFIWQGNRICENKLIQILLFYNPLTFHICLHYWDSVVINVMIIAVVLYNEQQPNLLATGLAAAIVACVSPTLMPVVAVSYIDYSSLLTSHQTGDKNKKWVIVTLLLTLALISVYFINYNKYFATQFDKNSGLMWLLYSHTFQRYLFMYQTIMMLVPFVTCVPIALIDCPLLLKITTIYFIGIFTMPVVNLSHLVTLFCLQLLSYHPMMACINRKQQITWNVLTIMMLVISIPTYILYERTVGLWMHTHMVSVGYYLLQILLFWGVHAVYLSEGLGLSFNNNQDSSHEQEQQKQKLIYSIVKKLWKYLTERVAHM